MPETGTQHTPRSAVRHAHGKDLIPREFLGVIAVVPAILFYQTNNQLIQSFGGTSILIMVGVALETMTQLESQLKMRHYDGFFK